MPEPRRTQQSIAALDRPGLYRFSPGLYLQVGGPQAKSWLYRYMVNGKARAKGLGSARDVTFSEARKRVEELRVNKTSKKIDPIAEERERSGRERMAKAHAVPFHVRAQQYITAHEDGWRNRKHRDQWRSTLETYVYPFIGEKPANLITAADVVEILRPIWVDKWETARRVRGRLEAILDYAADPDDPLYRNPASLTAQLAKKLPKVPQAKRAAHHPSLQYEQMAAFMADLKTREGVAARALEFVILTAVRTSEALGLVWSEIDLRTDIWTIPAERMKSGRAQRIPLSPEAVAILQRVRSVHGGAVVFPSLPHDRPLSNMALLTVLKRMGRRELTVHGFRSTFRTWAAERTNFPREVAESALAHVLADKTEAAYQRGDLFDKRRRLMNAWAEFCNAEAVKGDLVPLRA